jgi:signal transduction histidine kinase/ActR/RegA family two-component response regulator
MMLQSNPEAIPFGIAAAVSGTVAIFAWRRRSLPMASAFIVMMAGEAAWALFEALELVCADITLQGLCFELRTAGAVITILGMLAFVLRYTGSVRWLEPRPFAAICAPALALILVAWTNPWHHRYWVTHLSAMAGGHQIAVPVYAAGFWLHFAYCYVLVAVASFLLAQATFQSAGVYRAQAAVMLFAVTLPWVVNMIDMSQVLGYIHIDTAAMTFAVTGLAFLPGLFRFRLLDLTPVAWAVVVKGMTDPVVVFDPGGRIVELNQAASRLIGKPYAEVLGAEAERAFAHWGAILDRLEGFKHDGEVTFEIDGPDPDKPSSFDGRISRLGEDVRPAGWVLVLRDVTVQHRAAAERVRMLREQSARAEAEAANVAKDRFLATLSHELRTPLTPVLATVTAMLGDHDTPDSLRGVLEMIRRNVVLEARLIDDLLDLSRIRQGSLLFERELSDAHQLIHDVVNICRDDLRKAHLQLEFDLEARRHHIDADPIRFQQALWNLIKNAVKFTPAGGRLTVRSRNRDRISAGGDGRPELIIEVQDTGIGIEPDLLPRIFDVLEQGGISTTRRFGGLGLGLTISRSIVEQHGGRLTASSPGAGQGATLTIEMSTAAPPPPGSADDAPAAIPAAPGATINRPIKVLLVDDNHDTLKYLARLLSARGYHVASAVDMASALQAASETDFDVLVSDIELPDGSGLELMWSLRAGRAVPAIALSGFGAPADVEQSRSAGFAIHLTKPVDFGRLEQAIQTLAARSPVTSSA